jgi:two-component system nitrate/nitrite response regulator NarL
MRALIADDHPLYLDAAKTNIERSFPAAEIVVARSFGEALARAEDSGPFDFILLDYFMPGMAGGVSIAELVAGAGGTSIAVMSGNATAEEVAACVAAGAKGFLPKTMDAPMFAAAVNMILIGGTYVPTEFSSSVAARPAVPADDTRGLSPREIGVLELIVAGASNKEIARKLEIQEVTVKLHANRIFNKLGVRNRAQAAVKALDEKLVRR